MLLGAEKRLLKAPTPEPAAPAPPAQGAPFSPIVDSGYDPLSRTWRAGDLPANVSWMSGGAGRARRALSRADLPTDMLDHAMYGLRRDVYGKLGTAMQASCHPCAIPWPYPCRPLAIPVPSSCHPHTSPIAIPLAILLPSPCLPVAIPLCHPLATPLPFPLPTLTNTCQHLPTLATSLASTLQSPLAPCHRLAIPWPPLAFSEPSTD